MHKWICITLGVLGFLYGITVGPVFGKEKRTPEQKLMDAYLSRKHPDGKGPSSTSAARGYYKGTNGQWNRR